ncbi:MAG TPA: radical SAM protein [Anaerolineae bacterium]|nr:radical SAM protein [Anaerolineae bacterium]
MKPSLPELFQTRHFLLDPSCYLVGGAKRSALYNLKSGNVFSIDETAAKVLERCENGLSLEAVLSEVDGVQPDELMAYLKQLAVAGMGNFYERPLPFIEKLQPNLTLEQKVRRRVSQPVSYAFLELTPECNYACTFCTPTETAARRRTGCMRWVMDTAIEPMLRDDEWLTVIDDLAWIGCPALHFIGGEPLLREELLIKLIDRARGQGIAKIYLSTNTTLLGDEQVDFFARQGVHLFIQLVSHRPAVHDRLTGCPGSYRLLTRNLGKLKRAGCPYSFTLLLTEDTHTEQTGALEYFRAFDPYQVSVDWLRPGAPRDAAPSGMAPSLFRCRPQFPPLTAGPFFQRRDSHACWMGKLAITANGSVLPCIIARKELIGHVRHKSVKHLYRDKDFDFYWHFNIDKVEGCNGCEFRYACFDCRPLARSVCGRLTAKDPYCTYAPLEGRWLAPTTLKQVSPAPDDGNTQDTY